MHHGEKSLVVISAQTLDDDLDPVDDENDRYRAFLVKERATSRQHYHLMRTSTADSAWEAVKVLMKRVQRLASMADAVYPPMTGNHPDNSEMWERTNLRGDTIGPFRDRLNN